MYKASSKPFSTCSSRPEKSTYLEQAESRIKHFGYRLLQKLLEDSILVNARFIQPLFIDKLDTNHTFHRLDWNLSELSVAILNCRKNANIWAEIYTFNNSRICPYCKVLEVHFMSCTDPENFFRGVQPLFQFARGRGGGVWGIFL